jgi:hypothetical protein
MITACATDVLLGTLLQTEIHTKLLRSTDMLCVDSFMTAFKEQPMF